MSMLLVPSNKTKQLYRRTSMLMSTMLNYNDGVTTSLRKRHGVGLFTYLSDLRDELEKHYDFSDSEQLDLLSGGGGD